MKSIKLFALALTALGCMSMVADCPEDQSMLSVGSDVAAGLAPYESRDNDNNLVGFDKEVACELRKRLGFNMLPWTQFLFGNTLFNSLENGSNIVISNISITPALRLAFGWVKYNDDVLGMVMTPATKTALDTVAPAGTTTGVNVLAKLNNLRAPIGSAAVGFNTNRREGAVLNDANFFGNLLPIAYDTRLAAVDGVKTGGDDAYFTDNAVANNIVAGDNTLVAINNVVIPTTGGNSAAYQSDGLGIGINALCCQLYANVAQAIKDMTEDGTLADLRKEFNTGTFTPADLTPATCQGFEANLPVRNPLGDFLEKYCPCNITQVAGLN